MQIGLTNKYHSEGAAIVQDKAKRAALMSLFFMVFIYLVGFGVIIPVIPKLSKIYGATSTEVGLIMATYSFFQFLFAPFWGRLSDRIGRRSVLMVCLAFESLTYLGMAFADSFEVLFFLRSMAGVFGGSISTATAYVADITDLNERSKGMGLIGAAFGLGFVLGPVIGGLMMYVGQWISPYPPFGLNFPAVTVFVLCIATFIYAWRRLPEPQRHKERRSRWALFQQVSQQKISVLLLACFFAFSFAMANIEPTLFLLVYDRFGWSGATASFAFAYVGVMIAFTQGFLIRKLLPRFGEPALIVAGSSLLVTGFVLTGVASGLLVLVIAVTCIAVGNGLVNPSVLGSLSSTVSRQTQGEIFGVTQSLAALGRILGPICGGAIYALNPSLPFWFAGGVTLIPLLVLLMFWKTLPKLAREGVV